MEKFTVTLNHHAHYGYVEYDPETKTANVVLDVPEAKARVEEFLSKLFCTFPHPISPHLFP